ISAGHDRHPRRAGWALMLGDPFLYGPALPWLRGGGGGAMPWMDGGGAGSNLSGAPTSPAIGSISGFDPSLASLGMNAIFGGPFAGPAALPGSFLNSALTGRVGNVFGIPNALQNAFPLTMMSEQG